MPFEIIHDAMFGKPEHTGQSCMYWADLADGPGLNMLVARYISDQFRLTLGCGRQDMRLHFTRKGLEFFAEFLTEAVRRIHNEECGPELCDVCGQPVTPIAVKPETDKENEEA